jgi:hypothetical protein
MVTGRCLEKHSEWLQAGNSEAAAHLQLSSIASVASVGELKSSPLFLPKRHSALGIRPAAGVHESIKNRSWPSADR